MGRLSQLLDEQGGICFYCGKRVTRSGSVRTSPNIDHVVPKSKGGLNSWDNVVASHLICNSAKGDRDPTHAEIVRLYALKKMRLFTKPDSPPKVAKVIIRFFTKSLVQEENYGPKDRPREED